MPNWCEGSLKVRGKRKDVFRFFTEGVNVYEYFTQDGQCIEALASKDDWLYVEPDTSDGFEYIYYSPDNGHYSNLVYIEGTDRAFIDDDADAISVPVAEDDHEVTVYASIKQAWDMRVSDWVKLSKATNLHFKLYGIESGGAFTRAIEVNNGELIENETVSYKTNDDFIWNCPFPWMGG